MSHTRLNTFPYYVHRDPFDLYDNLTPSSVARVEGHQRSHSADSSLTGIYVRCLSHETRDGELSRWSVNYCSICSCPILIARFERALNLPFSGAPHASPQNP